MGLFDNIASIGKNAFESVVGKKDNEEGKNKASNIVTLEDGTNANEKELPYGTIYINAEGKKVRKLMKQPISIESKEQMEKWLGALAPSASQGIGQLLQTQQEVLNNVFTASLGGMTIDNMLFSLQKALQCATSEQEVTIIRDNFCMMLQNFVFINEAKLEYAIDQNRMAAIDLLGQAGGKMMQCAVNIGMAVINTAAQGGTQLIASSIQNTINLNAATTQTNIAQIAHGAASNIASKETANKLGMDAVRNALSQTSASPVPQVSAPIIRNPFEGEDSEKMFAELLKTMGKKKFYEEKRAEFDKMMHNLFPTLDRYFDLIGPSILICELLDRYSEKLVKEFEIIRYTGIISRIKDFRPPKKFLAKAPPTDYDYVRALEIETTATAKAAEKALKMEREELEEYKRELDNMGIVIRAEAKQRKAEIQAKIKAQEEEVKRQRDIMENATNVDYKLQQILAPIKADVDAYRAKLKAVVDKYDIHNY